MTKITHFNLVQTHQKLKAISKTMKTLCEELELITEELGGQKQ